MEYKQTAFDTEENALRLPAADYTFPLAAQETKSFRGRDWDQIVREQVGDSHVVITRRELENGDLFLYLEVENPKALTIAVELDRVQRDLRFDELYQKPGYDKRYGENSATGLLAYLDLERGSAAVSKVYYHRVLEEDGSRLLELLEESGDIGVQERGLSFRLAPREGCASFFLLLSREKLFRSADNLNAYMEYYYRSLANNAAWASFFMLPDGTYTKLPYSVEPFSKNGYGFNLHHSSRRDLMPLYDQTRERFYDDLLCNAVLQAEMYQEHRRGAVCTPYTSRWLKQATGIGAPYVDTRLNEFFQRAVREWKRHSAALSGYDPLREYVDFLEDYRQSGGKMYQTEGGLFFPDYFGGSGTKPSHSSLNHQIGCALLFFMAWESYGEEAYARMFRELLGFIRSTASRWINPETGDLYYGIREDGEGTLVFYGEEYVYVTLLDLMELQTVCRGHSEIGNVEEIDALIQAKVAFLKETEFSLYSLNAVDAPGEHVLYGEKAVALYQELYGPLERTDKSDPSLEQKLAKARADFQEQTARLQSMTSKFEYEQNKAGDLYKQLQSMTSKFEYEQNKAGDLYKQLQSMASKFEYEQNKAGDLYKQLRSMASKFEHEQNRAEELSGQLRAREETLGELQIQYNLVNGQLEETQKKIASLQEDLSVLEREKQLALHQAELASRQQDQDRLEELKKVEQAYRAQVEQLNKTQAEMQKELDMFRNSKMIKILRFWVWRVPTAIRRRIKKAVLAMGRRLYVRLLPYPRARAFCARINGRLKIIKNPQALTASPAPPALAAKAAGEQQASCLKEPSQLNVAMILDEFSYNSFRFECNALPLEPGNWRQVFEENDIDLFFCESAWAGADSIRRPWRGQIYCSERFPRENRGTLLDILDHCKRRRIPSVFWNKEDPAHYEDTVHNFVDTALKFDHIFTTASECVRRYKEDYGHPSVHLLMFASQPRLFNPMEKFERTEEVIFAGSWYNQHPERCEEMGRILDTILAGKYPLKIYNRQSENTSDPNHVFPQRFLPYIHPRLPHDQLDAAYKGSKYALNINTVTGSPTMFARRVFELMSSNTLVVSNYSRGMEQLFGDDVVFTDGTAPLDLAGADEKRRRALYNVLRYHTYRQRFEQILTDIGFAYGKEERQVILRYQVGTPAQAEEAVSHFYRVSWANKRALLCMEDGCPPAALQEIVTRFNGGMVTAQAPGPAADWIRTRKDSAYLLYADPLMDPEFVADAMAHYSYLDSDVAIGRGGEPYRFGQVAPGGPLLLPPGHTLYGVADRTEAVQAYLI